MFTGAGWSRVGTAASRREVTIKGQARPGKSARNSSTTRQERTEASGEAGATDRSDEGTRRDERAQCHESAWRGQEPKNSRGPRTCKRSENERTGQIDRSSDD